MEKLTFNTSINAPCEKVWSTLWNDDTYPEWTSVFSESVSSEGSRAETDWQKGSKVLFTDGKGSGMVSMIADNKPNEYMSFKHLGVLKDGIEDTSSEEVKQWAGAYENYTLNGVGGRTELTVDMDINDEYKDYFQKTFPKALDRLKELSEKS